MALLKIKAVMSLLVHSPFSRGIFEEFVLTKFRIQSTIKLLLAPDRLMIPSGCVSGSYWGYCFTFSISVHAAPLLKDAIARLEGPKTSSRVSQSTIIQSRQPVKCLNGQEKGEPILRTKLTTMRMKAKNSRPPDERAKLRGYNVTL